jgi:hypothetical protein
VRSASEVNLSEVEACMDREVRLTKKNESSESAVWTFQPQTESVERSSEEDLVISNFRRGAENALVDPANV